VVSVETSSASPVRASSADGFLLGLESLMRRTGQGRHMAGTVLECEGQPDLAEVRRIADLLGRAYPILHARSARGGDWLAKWRTDEVSARAVPVHCWHLPGVAGEGAEIASLEGWLTQRLNAAEIDIHAPGPNLDFHVILTSARSWAFVLLWSHSLLDAVGMMKFLQQIAALSTPGAVPVPDVVTEEAVLPVPQLYQKAKPVIEELRRFPRWKIRSLHRKGTQAGESRFYLAKFDREATAAIRAKMAKTAGELLLLPYFASCASRAVQAVIAARHPEEKVAILLTLPVQRQSDPAKRPVFRNHMTPYTVLLEPDELGDLKSASKALYRKYADFMRRKLPAAMHALMQMMERCPSRFYNLPTFFYMRGEICSLFHSHTGEFLPGAESVFGSRILNGYHVPSVSSPPGIGIFFSEHAGLMTLTISWKEGCLSSLELELMKQILSEDLGAPLP